MKKTTQKKPKPLSGEYFVMEGSFGPVVKQTGRPSVVCECDFFEDAEKIVAALNEKDKRDK